MKNKLKIAAMILAAIFLIIGVPVIINELYKLNRGYITIWGAPEVFSYYGTILAAAGGILGVFFTVKYSQKQYREDARQQIMPFISTDFTLDRNCFRSFERKVNVNPGTHNAGHDHFVIRYTTKDGVQYPYYLSEEETDLLLRNGNQKIEDKQTGAIIETFKLVYFVPCILKNVGNGVSLKTTFGLYKLKDGKYTEDIDKRVTSKPLVLDKGEQIYIGMFFDLDDPAALGTYKFDIMYSDMNYTRYRRSITIEFKQNPTTKVVEYQKIDTATYEIYSTKGKKDNG